MRRRSENRLWGLMLLGALLVAGVFVGEQVANAQAARLFRGRILFSDEAFPTSDKESEFVKKLKAAEKKSIGKSGEDWKLHILAFMNGAAGASELKLAFFDSAG